MNNKKEQSSKSHEEKDIYKELASEISTLNDNELALVANFIRELRQNEIPSEEE